MTRKTCARCNRTTTVNAYAAKYWGIQSKLDGKLICEECAWDELYKRMFTDVEVDHEHGRVDPSTGTQKGQASP